MKLQLNQKQIPVVIMAIAIMAVGMFVRQQMPKAHIEASAPLIYQGEIPGHTTVSNVQVATTKLAPGDFPDFVEPIDAYEAKVSFTLQRQQSMPFHPRLIDAGEHNFASKGADCAPEILGNPVECAATFFVPASALGSATFRIAVDPSLGDGIHQQSLPMQKLVDTPVELIDGAGKDTP